MEQLALMAESSTNRDLLAECREGNRDAMQALYIENQRRVYSIALNFFGGNNELASDITQQVFLKLLTKLDFRGDAEFTTFLYRMTINACIDETRKMKRFLNFPDWSGFSEAKSNFSLETEVQAREISEEVQNVVAALKPKFRIPLLLKYVEGLSYQEIADVLECSIGTVSSRLNRGHKMLAAKLGHLRNEVL